MQFEALFHQTGGNEHSKNCQIPQKDDYMQVYDPSLYICDNIFLLSFLFILT